MRIFLVSLLLSQFITCERLTFAVESLTMLIDMYERTLTFTNESLKEKIKFSLEKKSFYKFSYSKLNVSLGGSELSGIYLIS
jgi:hypothetical protein